MCSSDLMRDNTERPVTVEEGTNRIVGTTRGAIVSAAREVLANHHLVGRVPALWDGFAASRVADVLEAWVSNVGRAPSSGMTKEIVGA